MLDSLKTHLYGFSDTYFKTCQDCSAAIWVSLCGDRYEICGQRILNFIPFICSILNVPLSFFSQIQVVSNDAKLLKYYTYIEDNANMSSKLKQLFEKHNIKYSVKGADILSHSHGQLSVDEVYKLRYGDYKSIKCIDVVVYPTTTEQLETLYKQTDCKLIPYGGGTNVTGCLLLKEKDETKKYISVDMRHFNKITSIDKFNNYAIIQSGACGREIEDYLNKEGFTMGHEPDSYEFSTLGGWISTNASGMRRNLYGNIEEIVIDFGYINEFTKKVDVRFPTRHSHGPDVNKLFYGHEGNYGIITDVLVNIKRLPEEQMFNSILFYNMTDGISFLKEVQENNLKPSSIRLVDNEQFKFGQALKPEKMSFVQIIMDKLKKWYLFNILKFDINKMVACTLMIEGTKSFNKFTFNEITKIATKYNAIFGGSENGRAGYNLTHSIAYIRDYCFDYGIISETFETSIEWSKIEQMGEAVKERLKQEYPKYIKSTPFLSYRLSQPYNTGACVYFTFGFHNSETPEKGIEIYHKMENAMRETMIEHGGSISHHHGVGQIKADELMEQSTKEQIELQKQIKHLFDVNDRFCRNNYLCNLSL